jgi:hypothetical protein
MFQPVTAGSRLEGFGRERRCAFCWRVEGRSQPMGLCSIPTTTSSSPDLIRRSRVRA